MDIDAKLRSNVRTFYAWIGSMVLLGVAPFAAQTVISRGTLAARIAGVVLGVGATVPWMWVVFTLIRRGDEFVRRMHLVALAFAFVGASLVILTLSWLVNAEFIAPPDLFVVWFSFMVVWGIAIFGAKRYYERER